MAILFGGARVWKLALAALKAGLCLWIVLAGLNLSIPSAEAANLYFQQFPQGTIGTMHPEIRFRITKNEIDVTLQSYQMLVDDRSVTVKYDSESQTLSYTSVAELQPGQHQVEVILMYSGYEPLHSKWSFTVSEQAFSEVPTIDTADQREGLQAINDYRALFGLSAVRINNLLNHAALAHARYLSVNHAAEHELSMHEQSPDGEGFIGRTIFERREYVGYTHSIAEDVSYAAGTLIESIDSLFDAPYHRIPFLHPSMHEVGIAQVGDYVVIEFGFEDKRQDEITMIVSPAPGDTDVGVSFDGYEIPDPLRRHTSYKYPVGYALMATLTGENLESTRLVDAWLTDSGGKRVKFITNNRLNDDELRNEVILLPVDPLLPDSTYQAFIQVEAKLTDGSRQILEKTWQFHTELVPGMGKQLLHDDSQAYVAQLGQFRADKHVVTFSLTASNYVLDGVSYPMSEPVYSVDGSSYLWVRDLAAALDASVSWDGKRQAAIYSRDGRQVTFYTNQEIYEINGVAYLTNTPAQLVRDATFIPVRLLAEVLGAEVVYQSATQTVKITY